MKNWWYYYKWYVICGGVLFCISIHLIGNAFGWFKKTPDIQIAYIGETRLPDDTVSALENAFAYLAGDYNHDGETLVQINQFIKGSPNDKDADIISYRQALTIALMGDINDCESYFFLMEKPEEVQKEFQVLAMPDGSCPDDTDFSSEDKVFQWKSCGLLSELELGNYTTTVLGQTESGSNQELLSDLYLGRRCFYNKKQTKYADKCGQLWNILQGGLNGL
ncbi:MAG: hypothetical protein K1W19_16240 [Lachnospiraceae bacterium]|nr:hypothetical protein [Lachnospiraceae bacterium]MCI8825326.1 hypothetical protein [Lachnospiraceae bacterium]